MGSGSGVCYGDAMNKHVVNGHVVEADLERRLERVAVRMKMSTTELVNMAVFLERAETPEEELAGIEEERADTRKIRFI